jgi:hypothetical protein
VKDPADAGRRGRVIEELSLPKSKEDPNNVVVVVNWLQDMVRAIIKKVNDHAKMIKFTQKLADSKADQAEVSDMKAKVEALEAECDSVHQRSMKGNIIISSPATAHAASRTPAQLTKDPVTGHDRNEFEHEMCIRVIKEKTGITFPVSDIGACHALGRKGDNTSFIVRINNLRPGSAWDILAAGMLTGRNKADGSNFTDANVYLNFQLTKKRSDLLKAVREKRRSRVINKYGVDQNGKITVRAAPGARWVEVTSLAGLNTLCSAAPGPGNREYAARP